jgi:hypothetical protein
VARMIYHEKCRSETGASPSFFAECGRCLTTARAREHIHSWKGLLEGQIHVVHARPETSRDPVRM